MKLFKSTILPISNFGTPLRGDTLFGQICWAVRFLYGNSRLSKLLSNYDTKPFLIASDAFVSGFLPKPTMPSHKLGEDPENKKNNRKKIWLTMEELLSGKYHKARNNKEVKNTKLSRPVIKNSINYKTFNTGHDGKFSPYAENEIVLPESDIYFAISNDFSFDELKKSFEFVSKMGYGKNTTVGKGSFKIINFEEVDIDIKSNAFMTLSPSSLSSFSGKNAFYEPFTRFGKHGAMLANSSPFKKPLLLADTGAVVTFDSDVCMKYTGNAISGHSAHEETVHQGYSIVLPIKEKTNE